MYKKKKLQVHIELSNKCNAMCPQCGRNQIIDGKLQTKPGMQTDELILEDYKKIFDDKFYNNFHLDKVNFCGNRSDPSASKDLFEIIDYVKSRDNSTRIHIATNGGLKTTDWWRRCGKLMSDMTHWVDFGIDGLEDTHHIYRQRTNFKKVIANATAFIEGGGRASWQFLVFKHNQHQLNDAKALAKKIGFKQFKEVFTPRFYTKEGQKLEFERDGKKYLLEESTLKSKIDNKKLYEHFKTNNKERDKEAGYIDCKAIRVNEFFLDYTGNVLPCCWLGNSFNRKYNEPWLSDNLKHADNIMNWYDPKTMNGISNDLTNILLESIWMKQLQKSWDISPCKTCARFCSTRINIKKQLNREML